MVTKTLALELTGRHVRVKDIGPGMISTPMTAATLFDKEQAAEALEMIPMGRPGKPQEIADVALFLASDESSYVTGSTFYADGGLMQRLGLGQIRYPDQHCAAGEGQRLLSWPTGQSRGLDRSVLGNTEGPKRASRVVPTR